MRRGPSTSRRFFIAAAIGACLLGLATPAAAKGFSVEGLRISGPTLAKPIVVGARRLVPNTQGDHRIHLTMELLGNYYPLEAPAGKSSLLTGGDQRLPSHELGPRFTLSYTLDFYFDRPEHARVVQHLYPFARRGSTAFTPPGQTIPHFEGGRGPVQSGWQSYSRRALGVLRELGLPEPAPATIATATTPRNPVSLPPGGTWDGTGIVVIGTALAAFALARRRRPSPA